MSVLNYNNNKVPLVSVFFATYNHENFIARAIEGFLMQITNFEFEIIITEDKSTDRTAEIIRNFEYHYPGRLIVQYHKVNLYSQKVDFFQTEILPIAKGKYIALCEGDDYWVDPYKLQKQVDFLECNPDYSLVHTNFNKHNYATNSYIINKNSTWFAHLLNGNVLENLLLKDFIKTLTVCFRKDLITKEYNDIYNDLLKINAFTGDRFLWIYFASKGKFMYLEDITGVYGIQYSSASHFKNIKNEYHFYEKIKNLELYFIEKLNVGNKIKKEIKEKWLLFDLRYAFFMYDEDLILKTLTHINDNQLRLNFKYNMFIFISKNKCLWSKCLNLIQLLKFKTIKYV